MMTREAAKSREQMEMFCLDDLVPKEHLVRKIEAAIDWSFIYELVEPLYCEENGRPSLDPVTLIKLPVLQYMFGIRSMRRTVQEVEANNAYRWFLGLGLQDPVPHFSTFSKNYTRRFKDTDLFEQIFEKILAECFAEGMVDPSVVFVDSTHVKARANGKKYKDEAAQEQALWYAEELKEEIQKDREAHGKKPLRDTEPLDDTQDDDNNSTPPPAKGSGKGNPNKNTSRKKRARQKKEKHRKVSTVDTESGWFRKGEHKHVFAYSVQTACDRHGIILGSSVHPGNENDGRTFKGLYDKIHDLPIQLVVGDTAYKTPAIARLLAKENVGLLSTYNRPKTQKGYFPKSAYVYDEYYDCYLCPADEVLTYRTTNRDGYREYKSDPSKCAHCPYLSQCTASKDHVKLVTRHVWAEYLEQAEENRYTYGIREWYALRKETTERDFAQAKELHGFRYTQMYGKARMEMKAALTFACINLRKLAKRRWRTRSNHVVPALFLLFFSKFTKSPTCGRCASRALSTV